MKTTKSSIIEKMKKMSKIFPVLALSFFTASFSGASIAGNIESLLQNNNGENLSSNANLKKEFDNLKQAKKSFEESKATKNKTTSKATNLKLKNSVKNSQKADLSNTKSNTTKIISGLATTNTVGGKCNSSKDLISRNSNGMIISCGADNVWKSTDTFTDFTAERERCRFYEDYSFNDTALNYEKYSWTHQNSMPIDGVVILNGGVYINYSKRTPAIYKDRRVQVRKGDNVQMLGNGSGGDSTELYINGKPRDWDTLGAPTTRAWIHIKYEMPADCVDVMNW